MLIYRHQGEIVVLKCNQCLRGYKSLELLFGIALWGRSLNILLLSLSLSLSMSFLVISYLPIALIKCLKGHLERSLVLFFFFFKSDSHSVSDNHLMGILKNFLHVEGPLFPQLDFNLSPKIVIFRGQKGNKLGEMGIKFHKIVMIRPEGRTPPPLTLKSFFSTSL